MIPVAEDDSCSVVGGQLYHYPPDGGCLILLGSIAFTIIAIVLAQFLFSHYIPNETAILLRNVDLLIKKRDYARAEETLQRLISLTERKRGVYASELLIYLPRLAYLRQWQDDPATAEILFQRVLRIQEKRLPANSPELLSTLGALAYLSRRKDDIDSALSLMRRILSLRAALVGEDELVSAGIYAEMGVLLKRKGENEAADMSLARAMEIRDEHHVDRDLANYVFCYFSRFMDSTERIECSYLLHRVKAAASQLRSLDDDKSHVPTVADRESVLLAQDRYSAFAGRTGERILAECRDGVFLNRCPRCGRVARTPTAKQCRYCRHDWHAHVSR